MATHQVPVYSRPHWSAPTDPAYNVNTIILDKSTLRQYGVPVSMVTILLYNTSSRIGAIEIVHASDLELMDLNNPVDTHATHILSVLLDTLENCPCPHVQSYGRWMHALRSAYDFADDLIVKLHNRVSGQPDYTSSIAEIKRYLSRMGTENLPFSRLLLNDLLIKEATRRFWNKHAKVIQAHWRHAIANPNREVCRRRLFREFTDMSLDQMDIPGRMVIW